MKLTHSELYEELESYFRLDQLKWFKKENQYDEK